MKADNQSSMRNELENLVGEKEAPHLDFKLDLHLESDGDKAEFTKDVLAIANTVELGYIVTGVDSETGERRGISERHTEERLNQILKDKTDPFLSVQYGEFDIDGTIHGIVRICGDNPPYLVAVPDRYGGQISTSRRKHVYIVRGTLFVRVGTQSIGASREHIDAMYERIYGGTERIESIAEKFFSAFEREIANYSGPADQTWVYAGFYPTRYAGSILDRDMLSNQDFLEDFRDVLMKIPYGIGLDWLPNPTRRWASENSVRSRWGRAEFPGIVLWVDVFGCVAWIHAFGDPKHQQIPLDSLRAYLCFFIRSTGRIYEQYDAESRIATVKVFLGLQNFIKKPLVPRFRAMTGQVFTRIKDPRRFPEDPISRLTSALRTDPEEIAAKLTDYVSRAAGPMVRID